MFAPVFLGVDSGEPDHDAAAAVLAEMANMICGAVLSRIESSISSGAIETITSGSI